MKCWPVRSRLGARFRLVHSTGNSMPSKILVMGASYGSLLATKLLMAGHTVKLACLPAEADLINAEGTRVRLPVKGREGLVEVDSRKLPGKLSAGAPASIDPAGF